MTGLTINIEQLWDQKYRDISVPFPVDGQVAAANVAAATTYYVSQSGGSDANNGLATTSPWQTIAKVNASKFNPGDQILFKRGDTWRGTQLTPPSSGDRGRPIIFGAYGAVSGDNSGALPIFTGGSILAGPWTNTGDQNFGETSIRSLNGVLTHGFMQGSYFVVGQAGTIKSVTAYLDGSGGGGSTQGLCAVVYANSGTSPTGAALGVSTTQNVTVGQAAGWVTFTFSSPFHVTAGTYHLAIQAGGTTDTARIYYQNTGATNGRWATLSGGETLGSPPSSPTLGTTQTGNYSIYATYTPDGATYSTTLSAAPVYLAAAGVTVAQGTALNTLAPNQWWWQSNTLYLNLNGTNPGGVTVEQANLSHVIVADGVEWLEFHNLDVRFAKDGGALGIKHILYPFLVKDCHFQNNGFISNGGVISTFICEGGGRITNCTFKQNDNDCIWCGACPDMQIDNNTITTMSGDLADGIQMDGNVYTGASGRYSSNYWIHHNTIDLTGYAGFKGSITTNAQTTDNQFYGGVIEYNTCNAGSWGVSASNSGCIVRYNRITNCVPGTLPNQGAISIAAQFACQDIVIRNNVVIDCARGIYIGPQGVSTDTNILIYNNTVIRGTYRVVWFEGAVNCVFKNNIIWCPNDPWGDGSTNTMVRLPAGTGTTSVDSDYNVLGPEAAHYLALGGGGNVGTLADWRTLTSKDAHSTAADPTFAATLDEHLAAGSPAIDTGTILAGLAQDTFLGTAPDMGAHEYPRYRQIGAIV